MVSIANSGVTMTLRSSITATAARNATYSFPTAVSLGFVKREKKSVSIASGSLKGRIRNETKKFGFGFTDATAAATPTSGWAMQSPCGQNCRGHDAG